MGLVQFKTEAVHYSADTFVINHSDSYRDGFTHQFRRCGIVKIATFAKPEKVIGYSRPTNKDYQ
jgi:hypothetical protein